MLNNTGEWLNDIELVSSGSANILGIDYDAQENNCITGMTGFEL